MERVNVGIKGKFRAKAHFIKAGNLKIGGHVWTWSKLKGGKVYALKDDDGKIYSVIGSCGGYCEGCEKECYVNASYRYPSVIKCHAENTQAFREDIDKAFEDLEKQIDRARNKPAGIRLDQSGEIETRYEFERWVEMAKKHPEIIFWVYTKAYAIVLTLLPETPLNLITNISIWHEYGINEYLSVAHLPNVSTFVLVDKEWTRERYAEHGIFIQCMCGAYDINGKMNHAIQCFSVCRHCMRGGMVIGCYEH